MTHSKSTEEFVNEILQEIIHRNNEKVFRELLVPYFLNNKGSGQNNNRSILHSNSGNNNGSECAGTYPVSGYKRSDGTEVSSYMRTCGAAHNGAEHKHAENKTSVANIPVQDVKYGKGAYITNSGPAMYSNGPEPEIYANKNMNKDATKQYERAIKLPNNVPLFLYYKLSILFADGCNDIHNQYENNDIYKFNNSPEYVDKKFIFNKIVNSLGLDPKYNMDLEQIQNTKVVVPQENAQIIGMIKKSPTTAQMIKANIQDIINGKTINTTIEYKSTDGFNEASLYGIIKRADIRNLKVNKDGIISFYIVDIYDFEKMNKEPKANPIKKGFIYANNNADIQQRVGKLKPYVLYIPVTLSQEEVINMLSYK